jgi:hypothetical protein
MPYTFVSKHGIYIVSSFTVISLVYYNTLCVAVVMMHLQNQNKKVFLIIVRYIYILSFELKFIFNYT